MICNGNSATLTANGASNYTWNPGNNSGSSIVITPSTSVSYTLLGGTGNCTNTAVYTLSVTNIPTVTAVNASVCSGNQITLLASGATSYTWTLPTGWVGASTTNTITVQTNSNSGNITVAANANEIGRAHV